MKPSSKWEISGWILLFLGLCIQTIGAFAKELVLIISGPLIAMFGPMCMYRALVLLRKECGDVDVRKPE